MPTISPRTIAPGPNFATATGSEPSLVINPVGQSFIWSPLVVRPVAKTPVVRRALATEETRRASA